MSRALRAAANFAIAPACCLALYWYGLKVWFFQDDFAWLGLRAGIYSFGDFVSAMFSPMSQGTIRPWSERAFFMGFYELFGLDALPFHICVFVTQVANLTLISLIVRRLTGSVLASIAAPVLWLANCNLVIAMTWAS